MFLNFDCKKGEAVFCTSFYHASKIKQLEIKTLPFMEIPKHFRMLDDDRLTALVGALIVENSLETCLSASLLGYKKELFGSKDFFFSWKIAVAKSLRFCPNKILTCADVIRQIRNEFAHNLGIKDFVELKSVSQKRLDDAFLSIVDETPRKERTMREVRAIVNQHG